MKISRLKYFLLIFSVFFISSCMTPHHNIFGERLEKADFNDNGLLFELPGTPVVFDGGKTFLFTSEGKINAYGANSSGRIEMKIIIKDKENARGLFFSIVKRTPKGADLIRSGLGNEAISYQITQNINAKKDMAFNLEYDFEENKVYVIDYVWDEKNMAVFINGELMRSLKGDYSLVELNSVLSYTRAARGAGSNMDGGIGLFIGQTNEGRYFLNGVEILSFKIFDNSKVCNQR